MRLRKGLAVTAIAAAGILGLSACTDSADTGSAPEQEVQEDVEFEAGTTMAELNEAGKITIGTKFDQPLFGQVDADGNPQGFDVEIGKIIAAELGIPEDGIEWKEAQSANREPFIQSGEVDIVIATYTINDKRKEVIDFAGPYYNAGQDFLVLEGNPEGIEGPEDVAGKAVCTVTGSTSEANIREYTDNVVALGGYAECLEPLRQGSVVALTTDNVILAGLADQNAGEFEVVGNPFTEEPYGIGLEKGDDAFRTFINDTLEAAFDDGRWADAWEATAGTVLELPEPPTVDRY
ncbi:glutamate transport system substrate-binding protein [Diaminobutyricimonas aerilata]|uniref:Glutamate transport system substrate-binding protein n=1 Tax=Diaminobutyricimonas aerilata TaxID=1162967 RepID=A0A2M9CKQ3_9MICO|nr:glutamate ABC transporter substrate-binding protein [Diaminobutyricimonas aerilata]PJJ72485.1 glutamate transport system substrate-binding protein [Diaminobutyricimonas aerilata]